MPEGSENGQSLPERLRRALELVFAVEGVVGARLWQWPGRIAVGVHVGPSFPQNDTLRRVEVAVGALRLPDEEWDFGVLESA